MQKMDQATVLELMNPLLTHAPQVGWAHCPVSSSQCPDQLRQLAAGIAHDYNNLLMSMLCGAGLALDNLAPDHPARPALEIASNAVERAADLTRLLMAYAGISPFAATQVNLSTLVRNMVFSLRPSIPERVQLRLDLAGNLPPLRADSSQIQQLTRILIANAVEAIANDAAGVVSIRTSARHSGNVVTSDNGSYVQMEVTDTGCGMDDWIKSRIFEPFFSTKFLGRGMGLAAAAGIVRSHRGTVDVHSTPGSGSTFRVCLPAMARGRSPGTEVASGKDFDCR
jgi:two-component system cell cycle sensor histidine kinase/response regulator CckA